MLNFFILVYPLPLTFCARYTASYLLCLHRNMLGMNFILLPVYRDCRNFHYGLPKRYSASLYEKIKEIQREKNNHEVSETATLTDKI